MCWYYSYFRKVLVVISSSSCLQTYISPQIRARCVYPCECGAVPQCPEGVNLVRDGCGCCLQCARLSGQACDAIHTCDDARNLTCVYANPKDLRGVCQGELQVFAGVGNCERIFSSLLIDCVFLFYFFICFGLFCGAVYVHTYSLSSILPFRVTSFHPLLYITLSGRWEIGGPNGRGRMRWNNW